MHLVNVAAHADIYGAPIILGRAAHRLLATKIAATATALGIHTWLHGISFPLCLNKTPGGGFSAAFRLSAVQSGEGPEKPMDRTACSIPHLRQPVK
jgi:hypothetical protein